MLFRGIISPATAPLEQTPTSSSPILVVNNLPENPSSSTLYILAATHEPYVVVEGALVRVQAGGDPVLTIGKGLQLQNGVLAVGSSDEIAAQDNGTLEIQYVDVSKIKGDFALACGTAKP